MRFFASIAVALSLGASTALAGQYLSPARPVAAPEVHKRQTSREQVVRRMTGHGSRRMNKRQQASSVPTPGGAPAAFILQFSGSDTTHDNQFAVFDIYGEDPTTYSITSTDSADKAQAFSMTDALGLGSQGLDFLADVSSTVAAPIFFDTPGQIRDSGYITPTCKVANEILSCDFQGANLFALCPDGDNPYFLAAYSGDNLPLGCSEVTLNVISA